MPASQARHLNPRLAAEFRARHKLPYVDGFAAALASNRKTSLLTSDSAFAHVEKKLDILWAF